LRLLIGMSLLSVGGASSRRSQHLEVRKARLKCDRVSTDTKPTELLELANVNLKNSLK
jgi:hypothetical protein